MLVGTIRFRWRGPSYNLHIQLERERSAVRRNDPDGRRASQDYGMHLPADATSNPPCHTTLRPCVGPVGTDSQPVRLIGLSPRREPGAAERLINWNNRRVVRDGPDHA